MKTLTSFVFQITLNNTDRATEYVLRLGDSLNSDLRALVAKKSQKDKEKVDSCLAGFPSVVQKLKSIQEQVILKC